MVRSYQLSNGTKIITSTLDGLANTETGTIVSRQKAAKQLRTARQNGTVLRSKHNFSDEVKNGLQNHLMMA